jgi:hypothetical protein
VKTIRYRFLRRLQKAALIWIAASAALQLYGQGTIDFSNVGLGNYVIMGTPITVGTTTYAVGSKAPPGTIFSVALYWSPYDPANPSSPTAPFSQAGPTGHLVIAGVYNVGAVTIPGITPLAGPAWIQVKAWDTACGSTYEEALFSRNEPIVGTSAMFLVHTGDPMFGEPRALLPAGMGIVLGNGLGPGTGLCVPEPSAVFLVFVAAAILLFSRAGTRSRQPS